MQPRFKRIHIEDLFNAKDTFLTSGNFNMEKNGMALRYVIETQGPYCIIREYDHEGK